jgi:HD-GYP domain-containing protein (c-di-GMP phosphodiesterase class II)
MALSPNLEDQEVLADTIRRAGTRTTRRERLAELLTAATFVAAVAGLMVIQRPHHFFTLPAVLSMLVMVQATRVRFDTPFGFTVATQLAFVPLLFSMSPAFVPIAVALALALAQLPEVLSGAMPLRRLLRVPGNACFAIFPAAVFALVGTKPGHAGPTLLVAALAAQFVGDFVVSAAYFAVAREAGIRAQLRETWVYGIDIALSGVGLVVAEEIHAAPYAVLAMIPLLGVLQIFARERQGRLGNLLELNHTYRGTALLLGDVIAADDEYTGEHSEGVVGLALAVGRRLQLDEERRRNLEFGAMLHDVGKIAIPKAIINKPGKLDPTEWAVIQTHTLEGERMLARIGGFMDEVGAIVRAHHERWDGGGYPDRLSGPAIPLEARIITGCDSWNAMRTDRPYRRALAHHVAVAEIQSGTGSQFDPEVARALLEIVGAELVHPRIDEHVIELGTAGERREPQRNLAAAAGEQ